MPGSISAFRRQWDCIMSKLGIPHRQADRGATPGVLRGSGATFLYGCCEDVNWIAWRGRWARVKTLEYYLQEVAAQMLIHELSEKSKARIFFLSDYSLQVLECSLLAEQDSMDGKSSRMRQNNQTKEKHFMAFGRFDGSFCGASAKTADGLAFSNLGTFDHAGENRDAFNPFENLHHDPCSQSFGSQNPPRPFTSKEQQNESEQSDKGEALHGLRTF